MIDGRGVDLLVPGGAMQTTRTIGRESGMRGTDSSDADCGLVFRTCKSTAHSIGTVCGAENTPR